MGEPLRRTLGRTGLKVLALGMGGGHGLGPKEYRRAVELGVEYVDTARLYLRGEDEERWGRALRGGLREKVVLATKVASRDAKGAEEDLNASLKALDTDWIDIWQMHHVNTQEELERILAPGGALEFALKAQEQGKVRFIGITGHAWEQVQRNLETGHFATVLCWYNCGLRQAETTVFPTARSRNLGVVIMNATRWRKLLEPPPSWQGPTPTAQDLYRFVLSHPDVHVVLSGVQRIEELEENLRVVQEFRPLSEEERAWLLAYGDALREAGYLERR